MSGNTKIWSTHQSSARIVRHGIRLLGFLAITLSLPISAAVLPKLTPHQVQDGTASLIGHYNPDQKLRLVVGVQPPHMQEEEKFLRDLQDKNSPDFHKYLTADGWNSRFAPSSTTEQAVVEWATIQGLTVTQRYPNRLLVDVEGPVSKIEQALGVQINAYQKEGLSYFSNDRDPQIPDHLVGIIQSVGGLNNLQVLRPSSKNMHEPTFPVYSAGPALALKEEGRGNGHGSQTQAGTGVVPLLTNGAHDPVNNWSSEAYDYGALTNLGHCCNPLSAPVFPVDTSIAIATAGDQLATDFNGWAAHYGFWWHAFTFWIDGVPPQGDAEGTMDFEWSSAMANSSQFADTAIVYLYDGANAQFSTFTDVYNAILNGGAAKVFSTSWGCEETGCTPPAVMQIDHAIFNQMLGQGWTLIAAAGDGGATAGCLEGINVDAVSYPASDPDVLAAGGTTLTLNAAGNYVSEVGWSGGPKGCAANDGGSTGGLSAVFPAPAYQNGLGFANRAVPDMALNADWVNAPQSVYFNGIFYTNCITQGFCGGGTSIVAPELAGFFAQENAYLLYIGNIVGNTCGANANIPCAPVGHPHEALYSEYFGKAAPHYPFYDITMGCNNNNVTAALNLPFFCAHNGYDLVTGLGSANMLQLAWSINWWLASDFGAPTITFAGPAINTWYKTDQIVRWTVKDTAVGGFQANGVAGFSQGWDSDPGDVNSEAAPGAGNSFYNGPQYPNLLAGCLDLTGAQCAGSVGQGCHVVHVRAWDNTGLGTNDNTFGPICYDTIAPVTTVSWSAPLAIGGGYLPPVTVTLHATDAGSGVAATRYKLDNAAAYNVYTGPFSVSTLGSHTLSYYSGDKAGNVGTPQSVTFTIK